jgi:predicted DNA-binding transcriptional regulator YafY
MNPIERVFKIDYLLTSRKVVSREVLLEELGISLSTLKRDLEYMKSRLYAPIEWDQLAGGYRFVEQKGPGPRYQLPGLWFNASEAHALLTMQHLLANIEPGVLSQRIKPLQERLHAILGSTDHSISEIQNRIRILHIASSVLIR